MNSPDYPHPIRLRGPWDLFVVSAAASAAVQTFRVTPPCDWSPALGPEFRGTARFRRYFNAPDRLMPHERLWLVVEGADAQADVALNGTPLGKFAGPTTRWEHDINTLYKSRNELTIDVTADGSPGALGPVRLEVRWAD